MSSAFAKPLIKGRISYAVPFDEHHLHDPVYLGWMRDTGVVSTLNLPAYVEAPVSMDELTAYWQAMQASGRDIFLALHFAADNNLIGTLKAGHIDWHAGTADIGIMIGVRDYWGRGIATDAIHALCRYLIDAKGLRRLTAGSMAINPAMITAFEKLGFVQEGRLRQQDRLEDGSTCDHVLLGCLAEELVDPYAEARNR